MGTIAIQTQCCVMKTDDDDADTDAPEDETKETTVARAVPWHSAGRGGVPGGVFSEKRFDGDNNPGCNLK